MKTVAGSVVDTVKNMVTSCALVIILMIAGSAMEKTMEKSGGAMVMVKLLTIAEDLKITPKLRMRLGKTMLIGVSLMKMEQSVEATAKNMVTGWSSMMRKDGSPGQEQKRQPSGGAWATMMMKNTTAEKAGTI